MYHWKLAYETIAPHLSGGEHEHAAFAPIVGAHDDSMLAPELFER